MDDDFGQKLQSKEQISPATEQNDILMAWDGVLGLPQNVWNLFFAFLVVFGQVGQNVSLPLWFASVPAGESLDPMFILTFAGFMFVLIFGVFTLIDLYRDVTSLDEIKMFSDFNFLKRYFAVGFCNALNGIFLVFAASVTAPFLQAILGTFNILWTILFRFLILRKSPNMGQAIFALGVFFGLFLASVPSIFGLDTSDAFKTNATGAWVWLWPVIFASSFAPAAIMNVYGENVLKDTSESQLPLDTGIRRMSIGDVAFETIEDKMINPQTRNVNIWYYLFIQSVVQELTFFVFVWLDCMPHFGSTDTINDTFSEIKQDWRWFFQMDGANADVTVRACVFIGCYTLSYIGTSQMLRFTEGATWAAVVAALVTPLGGMFWLFFELDSTTNWFGWHPNFNSSSIYIIIGLLFMSPFIYLYDKEAADIEKKSQKLQSMKTSHSNYGYNLDDYDALVVNPSPKHIQQQPSSSYVNASDQFKAVL